MSDDSADVVLTWQTNTATAIGASTNPSDNSAGNSYRHLAITWVSMFEAANAISPRFKPYALSLNSPAGASKEAAVAAAAHYALSAIFGATGIPDQSADLDAKYAASLASIPDGQSKTDGIAVGEAAAAGILALRANDGWNDVVPYTPLPTPGVWRPTPLAFAPALTPQWGEVTPWVLATGDQVRPHPPSPLASDERARFVNEVQLDGSLTSTTRTADQTTNALFWASNNHQIDVPILVALETANGFDLLDSVRIGGLIALVQADAVIAGFDAKYTYDEWRPISHIQLADEVGNSRVVQDSTWVPLIVTPPFPDYVAQHTVLAGGFARVMQHFVRDFHGLAITSPGFATSSNAIQSPPGDVGAPIHIGPITQTFNGWAQYEQSVADARVFGGVHLRESCEVGQGMGGDIARYALTHALQRLDGNDGFDGDDNN